MILGDGQPPTLERRLLDVTRQRRLEEQLLQAQRLELLGQLAAGVAHDFNNVLTVIAGYAGRLRSYPGDESSAAITAAVERGARLVQQLLAFSRPQPTQCCVVDLNGVLRELAPMLRRVIGEDIDLCLLPAPQRLPVDVQPVQIDQVLMNIVINARDAMPRGGRLTITTARVTLDGSLLRTLGVTSAAVVTVTDTGSGMDTATLAQIFEPFFSTKEPAKGSGLGLATASGIVRQAGGTITVSSVPGEGTTFGIYLPLAAEVVATQVEPETETAPPIGGTETVLVVEDEPALRELEALTLDDAGYDVLSAANASDALLVAAEHPVDVLLVDVVMPGMSGPQLADELAARGRRVPAVFVSGYGADEVSNRGLAAGDSVLIRKPFQAEVLLRKVREVLDRAAPVDRDGP